jgi:3-isopropylmalate/(R)-2-methylmalate dehydratase large subunit
VTATHRRTAPFGALAFGIGTSEVEHVLATQTLPQRKPKTMRVNFHGEPPAGVAAKDMILAAIGQAGISGGVGYVVEYDGPAIRQLSMESRMTVCNMSIEWGARAGMIAPDDTTFSYMQGVQVRPRARTGSARSTNWRGLATDGEAEFDRELSVDVYRLAPQVTWGTNPEMVVPVQARCRTPADYDDPGNAMRSSGRSRTWARTGDEDRGHRGSTASSSGRARMRASRTCVRLRPWSRASTSTRPCAR